MMINKPLCSFDQCRKYADGNCIASEGYREGCEFRHLSEQADRLQKAFALACRLFGGCNWKDWQEGILARIESEPVCRVCGCTQDNACPGGCYWVEEDLCSQCAEQVTGK